MFSFLRFFPGNLSRSNYFDFGGVSKKTPEELIVENGPDRAFAERARRLEIFGGNRGSHFHEKHKKKHS